MSGKDNSVVQSLERLTELEVEPLPDLPDIAAVLTTEEIKEKAEETRQKAAAICAWVNTHMGRLDLLNDPSFGREERELAKPLKEQIESSLKELVENKTPAYRRAAWLAILLYELNKERDTREQVEHLMAKLVEAGYLIEDPEGSLNAYNRTYAPSPESGFGEPEIAAVKKTLRDLLNRVYLRVGEKRQEKTEVLKGMATISYQELKDGKPGKCSLSIPAEEIKNGSEQRWRGGGELLVESDGRRILPLNAVGSIEEAVREAKSLKITLLVKSLESEKPPFPGGASKEQIAKIHFLWHLIKRFLRNAENEERIASQLEELAKLATISQEEFFLDGKVGTCLAELEGTWKIPSPDGQTAAELPNLFFVVERKEGEGKTKIRLVEVPDHLKELLASCIGEEFPESPKFGGCPIPLGSMLRSIYGQVSKSAQIQERFS